MYKSFLVIVVARESEVTILINRFVFVGTLSNDVFNKQDSIHHTHLVLKCHS